MKKVLIINGHPGENNFSDKIEEIYYKEAEKKAEIKKLKIRDLNFDPILHEGYKEEQKLEKDLEKSQKMIKEANHIVMIYPTWWGGFPALLKGFIDRVFLPGFAFKFQKGKLMPKGLLEGKTVRIITTTGSPKIVYNIIGFPYKKEINILFARFCGMRSKMTLLGSMKNISEKKLKKSSRKIRNLARKLK